MSLESRDFFNGFGLGEGGDFTTELSYEAPKFKFSKNCHTKH